MQHGHIGWFWMSVTGECVVKVFCEDEYLVASFLPQVTIARECLDGRDGWIIGRPPNSVLYGQPVDTSLPPELHWALMNGGTGHNPPPTLMMHSQRRAKEVMKRAGSMMKVSLEVIVPFVRLCAQEEDEGRMFLSFAKRVDPPIYFPASQISLEWASISPSSCCICRTQSSIGLLWILTGVVTDCSPNET